MGVRVVLKKNTQRLEIMCPETGEVVTVHCKDTQQLINAIRCTAHDIDNALEGKHKSRDPEHIAVYQSAMEELVQSDALKPNDYRVILKVLAMTQWGNRLYLTADLLHDELCISRSGAYESLNRLKKAGFLNLNKKRLYSVNSKYAVKGKRFLRPPMNLYSDATTTESDSDWVQQVVGGSMA